MRPKKMQNKPVKKTAKTKLKTGGSKAVNRKSTNSANSAAESADQKYRKATLDYIGERIVEIRKQRKVKQRELARILDITEAHLRNMEKGNIYPRLTVLIRIINEFDINPNYLFLEHETKKTRYLVNT